MSDSDVSAFTRVLVANRGEIALRIVRGCHDAGITAVAVYADPDADSPLIRAADDAVALHGSTPAETYLDIPKLLAAAAQTGADAVHPGYGFLAENADFAQAVLDAGLVWIGPPPDVIRTLGDKVQARAIAARAGAPMAAGSPHPLADAAEAEAFAAEHGLPIAIKAAHGGGGRGLRIARRLDEVGELFDAAVREATAAFGRGECFVETYIERGRHVEVQVLADAHGTVQVIGTRDCTLQRRYQKLVEEAPAPWLTDAQRQLLGDAAVAICTEAGYVNAGTVEFLLAPDGSVAFLEVNTRLQVEHTVTEETTDVDLVRAQLRIAAGYRLDPAPVIERRHAIEFRINAEDPLAGFAPCTGTITRFRPPSGPGVRLDSGVEDGTVVGSSFDSLLAKLIVVGVDRPQVLQRARRALAEFEIEGPSTTLPFLRAVVDDPAFTGCGTDGFAVHTRWIEQDYLPLVPDDEPAAQDGPIAVRIGSRWLDVAVPGLVAAADGPLAEARSSAARRALRAENAAGDTVTAPMQGTVTRVAVADGDEIEAGAIIAVVEAMKMENPLRAPHAGRVGGLRVKVGQTVAQGDVVGEVIPARASASSTAPSSPTTPLTSDRSRSTSFPMC